MIKKDLDEWKAPEAPEGVEIHGVEGAINKIIDKLYEIIDKVNKNATK